MLYFQKPNLCETELTTQLRLKICSLSLPYIQGGTYCGMLKKLFAKLQRNQKTTSDVNAFKESEKTTTKEEK